MQHPELNNPNALPSISLVIRTHNEAPRLKLVLASLLKEPAFEVVVTDDGSTDDTAATSRWLPRGGAERWLAPNGLTRTEADRLELWLASAKVADLTSPDLP